MPQGAICFLDFRTPLDSRSGVGVALALERAGRTVRVGDVWRTKFGKQRIIEGQPIDWSMPLVRWKIVARTTDAPHENRWPLWLNSELQIDPLPSLDPTATPRITFSSGGNFHEFAFFGWSETEGAWTWSQQHDALLVFRPLPLPAGSAGLDLLIDAFSSASRDRPGVQRMTVQFNGAVLDTLTLPPPGPTDRPSTMHIDAALWAASVSRQEARVLFTFPDAVSPYQLGVGADYRIIGGGFRSIEFRLSPPGP